MGLTSRTGWVLWACLVCAACGGGGGGGGGGPDLGGEGGETGWGGGTLQWIDPLANGDFEANLAGDEGKRIFGLHWCGGEAHVAAEEGGNHVLRLAAPGETASQRFPAYEYTAQGPSRHLGATDRMRIHGRVKIDPGAVARVVVAERERRVNGAFFAFFHHFDGDPHTLLDQDWRYWTHDVDTGAFTPMYEYIDPQKPGLYTNGFRSLDPPDPSAQAKVMWNWQQVGDLKNLQVVRAWVAPLPGLVRVQLRCAWDEAVSKAAFPGTDTRVTVVRLADETSMKPLETLLDDLPVRKGEVIDFERWVEVEAGNVLAFVTREANPSAAASPPVRCDPVMGYTVRRVEYLFADHPLSVPPGDAYTCRPPPRVVPPGRWTDFTLEVGRDYTAHFHPQHLPFFHGPVPGLSLRIENASEGARAVYFDDLHGEVGFLKYGPEKFRDRVLAEWDRVLENWRSFGFSSQDYPCPDRFFDLRDGSFLGKRGVQWGVGNFESAAADLSARFWHPEVTPWLLDAADKVAAYRFPESIPDPPMYAGLRRPFDPAKGKFVQKIPDGMEIHLHREILFFLELYDFTRDVTYLDMAARAGNFILDHGAWYFGLYHSVFTYDAAKDLLEGSTEPLVNYLSRGGMVLARLAHRTAAFPGRALYRTQEYEAAAESTALFMSRFVDGYGWNPWWVEIDPALDDGFGYNALYLSPAWRETKNPLLLEVLRRGVEAFQGAWMQSLCRSAGTAGDQGRAWGPWLDLFHEDPAGNRAYGEAYVEAALRYVRGTQLGNGVWSSASVRDFLLPDMGGAGGLPGPVDMQKLKPLAVAFSDPDLYGDGQGPMAGRRQEFLAFLSTLFEVNRLHFGHYLETLPPEQGGLPPGREQVGYLSVPDYADFSVDPGDPKQWKAGAEWRFVEAFPFIVDAFEAYGSNGRPQAAVTPKNFGVKKPGSKVVTFTLTDPDGAADLADVQVRTTEFIPGKHPKAVTWWPLSDPAFVKTYPDGKTLEIRWVQPPELLSGRAYRFAVIAVDTHRRLAMDTAYYEIP